MAEQLTLSRIISDHAVLQRNTEAPIWGTAPAGAVIVVEFRLSFASTVADGEGNWRLSIPTRDAGGPFELIVRCGDQSITVTDLLVGEVWVCSGQSNMEFGLAQSTGGFEEVAKANYPAVRLFSQTRRASAKPLPEADGAWCAATPETVPTFSAVGWYFGRRLLENLDVPIGLIHTSWGGTPAEAWTPRHRIAAVPSLAHFLPKAEEGSEPVGPYVDAGVSAEAANWMAEDLDESQWQKMRVPGAWEATGLVIDGAVWFRLSLHIPETWAGRELVLSLGVIDDFDRTHWNGVYIGGMDASNPNAWATPRRYRIAGELVRPGVNRIAVRVFDQWAGGGFVDRPENLFVHPADAPDEKISLVCDWLYRVELELPQREPSSSTKPFSLYNGMLSPLIPYAIAGAIWYQGESNASRAEQYRTLFPLMIESWREAWGREFPFLFVLLANYDANMHVMGYSTWAELREAQLAALSLPGTAVASAIDIGEDKDIHPRNKFDVGDRLARAALAAVYGRDVCHEGPTLESFQIVGGLARITFKHDQRLHACDGDGAADTPIRGFIAAGADGVFHPAEARFEGRAVVVECKAAGRLEAVRYAWADNPDGNLYNDAALPANPFRTDDWPRMTRGAQ